jgi:hypothetical protein
MHGIGVENMTINSIRSELSRRRLLTTGTKEVVAARLRLAMVEGAERR